MLKKSVLVLVLISLCGSIFAGTKYNTFTSKLDYLGASSVSNFDGAFLVTPTTGAVVIGLNTAHPDYWNTAKSFSFNGLQTNAMLGLVGDSSAGRLVAAIPTGGQFAIYENSLNAGNQLFSIQLGYGNFNVPVSFNNSPTFFEPVIHESGERHKVRVFTPSAAVTVSTADYLVVVNKTVGAATAVSLPASPAAGDTYLIKDGKGDAAANNITVTPIGKNVDGSATYVLNVNYQKATFTYNGTQWNVT